MPARDNVPFLAQLTNQWTWSYAQHRISSQRWFAVLGQDDALPVESVNTTRDVRATENTS